MAGDQNANLSEIRYCSFCGKSQASVKQLVAGPKAFICDDCIVLCAQIMDDGAADEVQKSGEISETEVVLKNETLRAILRKYEPDVKFAIRRLPLDRPIEIDSENGKDA